MDEEMSGSCGTTENIRICLVDEAAKCSRTIKAAEGFNVPVIHSETGFEFMSQSEWKTYFVIKHFHGEVFETFTKNKERVLGPLALWHLYENKDILPDTFRPIFNYSMKGVIACFTGIRKKDELTKLVNIIHFMGGSIRKDMNSKVTHLICKNSGGEKYQYAMTFRLNIVRSSWVYESWNNKDVYDFDPTTIEFSKTHRLKPFEGYKICFFGFSPDEHIHMVDVLQGNGGEVTDLEDPDCSHVIMANTGGYFPETMSPPLSPINAIPTKNDDVSDVNNYTPKKTNDNLQNEESEADFGNDLKRKRDDIDNHSLISNDSFTITQVNSAKKPKLLRTGSISRTLKRSMSFVGSRTPLAGLIKHRRNSVDPNSSIHSISSFDVSLNKTVKEKFKSFRNSLTPRKNSPKKCNDLGECDFKTPKAPKTKSFSVNKTNFFKPSPNIGDSSNLYSDSSVNLNSTPINETLSTNNANIHQHMASINECDISLNQFNDGNLNMVIDVRSVQVQPEVKNNKTHIVKSEWFWYTIQNGYANESDFLFGDYLDSIANTPCSDKPDSLPVSCNKRKRKILQRKQGDATPLGLTKRRSSVSDAGLLSVSGSFLDCTLSPDKSKNFIDQDNVSKNSVHSMRFNHFMDFYTTESNYVGILETINNIFRTPLEERSDSNDFILNKSEVKSIFGNFASIHDVHKKMLQKLMEIQSNWQDDCSIGQIILDYKDDLLKAYPPYVNYFEKMKECLQSCDSSNPRFHAFLKINQSKTECGRQSLQDLMIRPVQRLPSISLLLNDILKYTDKSNPDHVTLGDALNAIKEVMKFINEDKRKTESQMAIFNIHKEIEGCPPDLISSHRSFIRKCEVTELTDGLSRRGDSLILYIFSDTIEVCKKKSSGSFKHVYLMPLSTIRLIINVTDNSRAFSLHCRHVSDSKDYLYSFMMSDDENDKMVFLKCLSKQIAEHSCKMDTDKQLIAMSSQELGIDFKDVNIVAKAFKLVARTRQKVERTFSFNKTPSKLKRAVSTMMTSPFGSTNSLTPSTQLAQMRLASCTNLNEISDDNNVVTEDELLIAPLSVQPTRRAKALTLNNLRRI